MNNSGISFPRLRENVKLIDSQLSVYRLEENVDAFIVVYYEPIPKLYEKLSDGYIFVNFFIMSEDFFRKLKDYENIKKRKII